MPTRKEMKELLKPARSLRKEQAQNAIQEACAEEAEQKEAEQKEAEQKEAERQSKVKAEQDVKQDKIDEVKMANTLAILRKIKLK